MEAINIINKGFNSNEAHRLIPKHLKSNFSDSVSIEALVEVDEEDNSRIEKFFKDHGYCDYEPIASFSINETGKFEASKFKNPISYWGFTPRVRKKGARRKIRLSAEMGIWQEIVTYIRSYLMPRILFYENFLFSFPERIYLSGPRAQEENNSLYSDIIDDIVQNVIPQGSAEKSLVENYLSRDTGGRDILDAVVEKLQTYISGEVFSSWGKLFNYEENKTSVALRFGVEGTDNVYLELKIKENTDLFYISERSLGFRWFFSFLFFTLFRKNRRTDLGETLFLLDEPASNLHSSAQKRLLGTFERFVSDEVKPLKLLYTTHSHHMINPKWLEGAFVVKNDAENYSTPFANPGKVANIQATPYRQFVAQHPNQQSYYQPVLDALDYQPGLLEHIPNIVITEGKNDYYTLRYMNEIIFEGRYGINNLFPGAGCAKNIPVIQLYLAWNREFSILLDSDKAGITAKQQYIDALGPIIKDKIQTYDELTPEIGHSSMEEIFSEDERLSITQLFNPVASKYKKSEFNTAIQEAFINKNKISLSKETLSKFEKLLSALSSY